MAQCLSSPYGGYSDGEEEMAVFESTAAEHGGMARPRLTEISVISPGLETRPTITQTKVAVKPGSPDERSSEKVKVFLRIRPLTDSEKGEEQGCVAIQDEETLLLKAPTDSQNMRAAERGITPNVHKFSFSKIFGPETTQQQFYEGTMKRMVNDVLRGENRLLYTYGVTNSGKTYTVQGNSREAGLLPRALVSLFRKLQGRLYGAMDLKPVMYQDVRQLDTGEIKAEEIRRNSLLKEDEFQTTRRDGNTTIWDSGIGGLSSISHTATQLEETDSVCLDPDSLSLSGGGDLEEGVQFSIWVSFYEIYNEFLYDLLDASPSQQPRKRVTLRLSDDKQGNPYVKDLTWIQIRSAEEAWRILKAGRRNQSFASTHLNQNSSRSHSIFSIRVLHVHPEASLDQAMHISELAVCDLAGSERCKEQRVGERMKEASNINTSLMTLGRCIAALRHNQNNKSRPPQVVPFRDSKLTRVLQGFFCGRGTSCMVVNINPCASIYDETLQALKFSAIATQLVHGPSTKTRVAYILSLLREPAANCNESTLIEEEEEDESDVEDGDITQLDVDSLLRAIEVLRKGVWREREEKKALEAKVRLEVHSEMMEVITKMKEDFAETLEVEKGLIEQNYENKLSILEKHLKKYYNQQLKERDQEIEELSAALEEKRKKEDVRPITAPGVDSEEPRRSLRLSVQAEVGRLRSELDQCRAELLTKTQEMEMLRMKLEVPGSAGVLTTSADRKLQEGQRNLRQLRQDLQKLGVDLQSSERACCRNTGAERLRQTLTAADETLAKQNQILMELQNDLTLVKADLRQKAEMLAGRSQPPQSFAVPSTSGSCKKRGCAATTSEAENHPPQKRHFFQSMFPTRTPTRKCNTRMADEESLTPYSRILRSRQPSPPPSPFRTPHNIRGKY
ncbi:kinesin-like protein KIF20A [Cyprinodon tularosa]|uniref:kinesin-like protein KIF20A n=1 Tax=Cyprinodon tularosa TaxID=77115 RepID=UPI0018E1FBFF|nr:kinesin-like protein KIF20A [Cyprinodon tularosa]XP_038133509.1 kinesin-like protein KIF20A [Cyprinodon tularosa]